MYFRWVVPQLPPDVWDDKAAYKAGLLDRLLTSKTSRKGIRCYSLAIESHADGSPHLDLLLVFEKKVRLGYTQLDFLCEKHGDLTRYRNLNGAILAYGHKEDTPLSNVPATQTVLMEQEFRKDPYRVLQRVMKQDVFHFNFDQYCASNDLFRRMKGFTTLRAKLKVQQEALASLSLKSKRGLSLITPALIRQVLTAQEQAVFDSWPGYCTIVGYINDMVRWGSHRPFKSKQLLLVGAPNTGKTSLIRWLSEHVSTYEVGVSNWFPRYSSGTYRLMSWNEFSLNVMTYPNLLKLLEGTVMDLQYKGGSTVKRDNPLIIMTSNLSSVAHLRRKFGSFSKLEEFKHSLRNFPARVHEVTLPQGRNLFFFEKIIAAASSRCELDE